MRAGGPVACLLFERKVLLPRTPIGDFPGCRRSFETPGPPPLPLRLPRRSAPETDRHLATAAAPPSLDESTVNRCTDGNNNNTHVINRDADAEDERLLRCYSWYYKRLFSHTSNENKEKPPAGHESWPLDFTLAVKRSTIHKNGVGLFVSSGIIGAGESCAVYPGIIFRCADPKFAFGFNNNYLLRRDDGTVLDGKPFGISGMAFRSLHHKYRDTVAGYQSSDCSWQRVENDRKLLLSSDRGIDMNTRSADNILLNCGHYVNHQPMGKNNVEYVEKMFDVDKFYIPASERRVCLLPYVLYGSGRVEGVHIPGVVLVANRDIHEGEELASNYENIIPQKRVSSPRCL